MSPRKLLLPLSLAALLLLASCSSKGVRMPKHRKQRHCDCPTFSYNTPTPQYQIYFVSLHPQILQPSLTQQTS